jgi:glycerol-3-phosphate acyltransferase PlsY
MNYWEIFGLTLIAYLLGSFAVGALYIRLFYGINVKEHGNGSLSWQNVQQVVGKRAGVITLVLSYMKYLLFPLILYIGNQYGGWFGVSLTPLPLCFFGIVAWLGENIPLIHRSSYRTFGHLQWGGTHAVHTGTLILCFLLGWDIYLLMPSSGFVVYHLGGNTQWLLPFILISLLITLVFIFYTPYGTTLGRWLFVHSKQIYRKWKTHK